MSNDTLVNEVTDTSETSQVAEKFYTQKEVDDLAARLKASVAKKYEKNFADVDVDEYRSLKSEAEKRQQAEQIKRGEFEKTLQELASKKDAEIAKRDMVIQGYKIDLPIVNAAAKFRAVNAEQVKALLRNNVRLNEEGEVEVLGAEGKVRYNDSGTLLSVDDLVQEFLDSNPHFCLSTPATTNSQTNVNTNATMTKFDLSKMDMTKADHRKLYKEAKAKGLA